MGKVRHPFVPLARVNEAQQEAESVGFFAREREVSTATGEGAETYREEGSGGAQTHHPTPQVARPKGALKDRAGRSLGHPAPALLTD